MDLQPQQNAGSVNTYARLFAFLSLVFVVASCKDHENPFAHSKYLQVNLVSDVNIGVKVDPALTNAWGIAISPNGFFWVSAAKSGTSTIYDKDGNTKLAPVTIPTHGNPTSGGSPTGQVYNSAADDDFWVPGTTERSRFIFAGEDGIISAWTGGPAAKIVVDRSAHDAVYKGLTLGQVNGAYFLYAANFKGRKIDVFYNQGFQLVTDKPFEDASIPADYGPFNIQNIDGWLYVTYAKLKGPDNEDDEAGPGNGFVNIFHPNGTLIKRFVTGGKLNSPWGITKAPESFGQFKGAILIGNFGDGLIHAYDKDGHCLGTLKDKNHKNIWIEGLWALVFPEKTLTPEDQSHLYFTAGPNEEENGLFGFIELMNDKKEGGY